MEHDRSFPNYIIFMASQGLVVVLYISIHLCTPGRGGFPRGAHFP
jgi:hypothetical protein